MKKIISEFYTLFEKDRKALINSIYNSRSMFNKCLEQKDRSRGLSFFLFTLSLFLHWLERNIINYKSFKNWWGEIIHLMREDKKLEKKIKEGISEFTLNLVREISSRTLYGFFLPIYINFKNLEGKSIEITEKIEIAMKDYMALVPPKTRKLYKEEKVIVGSWINYLLNEFFESRNRFN